MNMNSPTTSERLQLVKTALERAADGPKKKTAEQCFSAAEAAWAEQDEAGTVNQMNAASRALF